MGLNTSLRRMRGLLSDVGRFGLTKRPVCDFKSHKLAVSPDSLHPYKVSLPMLLA